MRRTCGLIMAGLMLAGCNNSGTTGPTGISQITVISASGFMPRGGMEAFTATATTTNGSTQSVATGVWGSDAPNVVQITPAGQATAMGVGLATIFVDFDGVRGTKLIRVVPNFAGTFVGTYTATSCVETGGWVGEACASPGFDDPPMPLEFAFLFSQAGATLTGQVALGGLISPPLSATVREDGGVTIDVTVQVPDVDLGTVTVVERWELRADEPGVITGTVHLVLTATTLTGEATVDASITTITKIGLAASSRDGLLDGTGITSAVEALRRRIR